MRKVLVRLAIHGNSFFFPLCFSPRGSFAAVFYLIWHLSRCLMEFIKIWFAFFGVEDQAYRRLVPLPVLGAYH